MASSEPEGRIVIFAWLTRRLTADHQPDAVGVSGMVPCVVLLDDEGRALRRSIQQNDARATTEIAQLQMELADTDILRRTGSPITQQSVAPTLRWLARKGRRSGLGGSAVGG